MSKLHLVNVASDVGSIYAGKSRAPAALKQAGFQQGLEDAGWNITESTVLRTGQAGWVSSSRAPNGARNEERTVKACQEVKKAMLAALNDRNTDSPDPIFQLILSGECLYCPSILSAYWQYLEGTEKRIGMVYIDADCDLATAADQPGTGNIAGMTLTHLTLRRDALESMKQFSRPDGKGVIDSSNIVLFGLNIESPANQRSHLGYLFDNAFRVHTSQSIQRDPVEEAKKALRWMEAQVDYVLVHLDVDVIDPGEFPLCNVPNYTGLGFTQVMAALKIFLSSRKTIALSLAEVNPDHDPELRMTSQLADALVDALGPKLNRRYS